MCILLRKRVHCFCITIISSFPSFLLVFVCYVKTAVVEVEFVIIVVTSSRTLSSAPETWFLGGFFFFFLHSFFIFFFSFFHFFTLFFHFFFFLASLFLLHSQLYILKEYIACSVTIHDTHVQTIITSYTACFCKGK